MAGFQFDYGLATSLFGEIADLDAVWVDGTLTVAVTGRFGVELWDIGSSTSQMLTSISVIAAPGTVPETDLSVSSGTASVLVTGDFGGGSLAASIPLAAPVAQTVTLGGPDRHTAALNWEAFGNDFYVSAPVATPGLSFATVGAGGTLSPMTGLSISDTSRVGTVTVLDRITLDGREFILALSTDEGRISVIELFGDGSVSVSASLGAAEGVPMSGAINLALAQVAGKTFVIVGAAQTSSLTVLELANDGTLTLTDHVIDTLNTRFEGATALDAVSGSSIGHVVAGGSDDGLTALLLTPEGRLVHLATRAGDLVTALDGVSALALAQTGDGLRVVSGDQTGAVSLFTLTPAGQDGVFTAPASGGVLVGAVGDELFLGSDTGDEILGGEGDDTLLDGRGADSLTGGAGADLFVFSDDGTPDRVTDFDPSEDRIDLTGYFGATDPDALVISGTSSEMTVTIGTDTLILSAASGATLTQSAIRAAVALSFDRPFLPTAARVLTGSEGADTLFGAGAADTIDGAGGDDLIAGEAGGDVLSGGNGNDILVGEGFSDTPGDYDNFPIFDDTSDVLDFF